MDNTVHHKSGFLSTMSPIQVFIFGVVEAILVLCTIGFFIMLGVYLKGDGGYQAPTNTYTPPVVNNGANVPPSQPTNVTVAPVEEKVDHIRGDKNAKITVIEYSDFECPFCKRFHGTMQQLAAKYPKDVKWVYRHFPLDSLHEKARPEAMASECAAEQGKFWEFADLIYQVTGSNDSIDLTKLGEYAKQIGLNVSKFQSCYDSQKFASRVARDVTSGEAAGANGTPYTVVIGPDGKTIPVSGAVPFDSLDATVAQFLK